jgi:hypothetical protein
MIPTTDIAQVIELLYCCTQIKSIKRTRAITEAYTRRILLNEDLI